MLSCSEPELSKIARELALETGARDRILIEGPLGAGKSTFARALIDALGVQQPPEGSPTFAIAHEYSGTRGEVIHIDFYRLRAEQEIEDAGIPEYFWNREARVICEWISLFPDFAETVTARNPGKVTIWRVELGPVAGQPDRRHLKVVRITPPYVG